jgi:hypothetical protein
MVTKFEEEGEVVGVGEVEVVPQAVELTSE